MRPSVKPSCAVWDSSAFVRIRESEPESPPTMMTSHRVVLWLSKRITNPGDSARMVDDVLTLGTQGHLHQWVKYWGSACAEVRTFHFNCADPLSGARHMLAKYRAWTLVVEPG
jgi:hypothetical protein